MRLIVFLLLVGCGTVDNGPSDAVDASDNSGSLTFSMTNVDYGSRNVLASGAAPSVSITATNTGTGPVVPTLSVDDDSNFTLSAGTCGKTLAPQEACTFSVDFFPKSIGSIGGHVTSSGSNVITLAGVGTVTISTTISGPQGQVKVPSLGLDCPGQCEVETNDPTFTLDIVIPNNYCGVFAAACTQGANSCSMACPTTSEDCSVDLNMPFLYDNQMISLVDLGPGRKFQVHATFTPNCSGS